MRIAFIFLTTCLMSVQLLAADVFWNKRYEGGDVVTNLTFTVIDGDFDQLLPANTNFTDVTMHAYVRLGVLERTDIAYSMVAHSLEVKVRITPYTDAGVAMSSTDQVLQVEYDKNGTLIEIDASDYRMMGTHKFDVEVIEIKLNTNVVGNLPEFVYLEGGISAERYYALNTATSPITQVQYLQYDNAGGFSVLSSGTSTAPGTEELYFAWTYVDGAEYYELEWTWVDNYTESSLSGSRAMNTIDLTDLEFKNNCTRIRTPNQYYRIPQIFAKGYLVYRVRAVGRWMGGDVTSEKFGPWSSGAGANNTVADWTPEVITISEEHEGLKNWQYQATYAEDGKKKDVAQYFDGSLRGRQTVTRINSNNQSVVGETMYDNEGRGVVQILPVPQKNQAIRFYEELNKDVSGNIYSHKNFDWEDTLSASCDAQLPDALSDVQGAGNYYSSAAHASDENWQQYVPDAQGYPYTVVEYTPDNTGRIRRQGGVGPDHNLGSNHETVYYYTQPTQEELNRLFGYKVGFVSRYKKNMVVDANGQVSISYLDAQGRVIATAMAGNTTDQFLPLDSESETEYHQLVFSDLLNKENQTDPDTDADKNDRFTTSRFGAHQDGLMYNSQVNTVNDNAIFNYNYTVASEWHEECDGQLLYPYVYDLRISVMDDCGEELFVQSYDSIIGDTIIGSALTDFESITQSVTYDKKGSYTLSKELTINEYALDLYVAHYLDDEMNPCLVDTFIFEVPEGCEGVTCEECADALGSLNDYLAQAEQDEGPNGNYDETYYTNMYNALYAACYQPCEVTLPCDVYKKMLKKDMSPGGQYAGIVSGDFISVMVNGKWRIPFVNSTTVNYLDDFGNIALVQAYVTTTPIPGGGGMEYQTDDNGTPPVMVEPWQLKRADFLSHFQPSWAEALIEYHPEYYFYLYTEEICSKTHPIDINPSGQMDVSSDYFDAILKDKINTVDEAANNSFGIDFWNLDTVIFEIDPYFQLTYSMHTSVLGGDLHVWKRKLMIEALFNYKGNGVTMFQQAASTVLCGNSYSGCTIPASFADPAFAALSTEDQDHIWQMYKMYYISQKGQINQLLMDMYGFDPYPGLYNGCIGPESFSYSSISSFNYSGLYNEMFFKTMLFLFDWQVIPAPGFGNFLNLPPFSPWPNFQYSLCSSYFNDKEIRITRMGALYNESSPPSVVIAEGSAQADYEQWSQTGLCPLTVDMERLLNALGTEGMFLQTTSMDAVPELVPDLYEAFSGVYPVTGATMGISGSVIGGGALELTFTYNQPSTGSCSVILPQLSNGSGSLDWADYGTDWEIVSISQSAPVTGTNYVKVLVEVLTVSGPQQYVVTYLSCVDLNGCQNEYMENNQYSVDCTKEQDFENALLALLQHLLTDQLLQSSADLENYTEYTESILMDYFGPLADWDGSTGTIIGSVGGVPVTFSFGSAFSSSITMITSLDLFSPDGTIYIDAVGMTQDELTTYELVNNFCYRVNKGECQKPDFSCPCEETQLEEVADAFENLLNELFQMGDPTGLQPAALLDMTHLFGGVEQEISGYFHGITYGPGDECMTYRTHWWPAGSDGRPRHPCLTFQGCLQKLQDQGKLTSISDFTFTSSNAFTATVYFDSGASMEVTGTVDCFQVPECIECHPQPEDPISCTDLYPKYYDLIKHLTDGFEPEEFAEYVVADTVFCDYWLAKIYQAYEYYIGQLGITSVNDPQYLSITEFGATYLGYSNDLLMAAVDAYLLSGYDDPQNEPYLTWNEYVGTIYKDTNPGVCPALKPPMNFPDFEYEMPCNQWETAVANVNAQNQGFLYLEAKRQEFIQAYIEGAMASVVETFNESHFDKEYHYTLYYYDRGGNLIQTVPPKGVNRFEYDYSGTFPTVSEAVKNNENNVQGSLNTDINALRINNPDLYDLEDPNNGSLYAAPPHELVTNYKYNSLNQLVYQVTPDGGESWFAYDKLGRLILSQNAHQEPDDRYSYSLYDDLGRVVEVGELKVAGYSINEKGKFVDGFNNTLNLLTPAVLNLLDPTRSEVTRTVYDEFPSDMDIVLYLSGMPYPIWVPTAFGTDYAFDNTRNRIVGVLYYDDYDGTASSATNNSVYTTALFYDYDVHGNVKELLEVNNTSPNMMDANQHVKRINYEYDLVSGNVNKVIYQVGQQDQFMHRYSYDADNRITIAETSRDGVVWEKDAKYYYYEHGPLARTELGEKKVQSLDYAYTIQGWLKAVNGEEVGASDMMGEDGANAGLNAPGGRDVFGYSLSYFDGDYVSANTDMVKFSDPGSSGTYAQLGAGLYNGNIRTMYTALSDEDEGAITTHQTNYRYDQLNRIRSMEGLDRVSATALASASKYASEYTFDENGNLETLVRKAKSSGGAEILMDDFEYHYNAGTNQLNWVDDIAGASAFANADIDNSMGSNNYLYDAIGRLVKDADEGIDTIFWTVTNKVKEIQFADGRTLQFDYDPMGNRIAKHLLLDGEVSTTYYALDAQGNTLTTYQFESTEDKVYLSERNIFGSSRLGQEQPNMEMVGASYPLGGLHSNETGDKRYELSNQLGNVLEVITDRKLPSAPMFSGYNFDYDLEGWAACTQATATQGDGKLLVSSYGASNCTYKTHATVAGEEYTVMVVANKGNAPNLKLSLYGIGDYTLTDGEPTWITFTATGASTALIIQPTSTVGSYNYSVDAVEIYQHTRLVADVVSYSDYYPYGMIMPGKQGSDGEYRYGFNGMEADDEVKGGNSYTSEFRQFDPRSGRWLSIDPKAYMFPDNSPYHFAYNSPLMVLDPNGDENVVIVGNQSKADGTDDGPSSDFKDNNRKKGYTYGENTRHFLQNGLDEARALKKKDPNEETTMVVYKGNYTNEEITKYRKAAEADGIKFLLYEDDADFTDYVNKKASWTWWGSTAARDKDPITNFTYIGHGSPTKMLLGYNDDKDEYLEADNFNNSAFDDKCEIKLRSCGSAVGEMFEVFLTYTNGNVSGYNTTVWWGQDKDGNYGIGKFRAHHQEYVPLDERDDPNRKTLPKSERVTIKKGSKK